MKRPFLAFVAAVFLAVALHADYLEVRRSANLYAKPRRDSERISSLAVGMKLVLLDNGKSVNGYYRAAAGGNNKGYVARTLVRRYPGSIPSDEGPAALPTSEVAVVSEGTDACEWGASSWTLGDLDGFYGEPVSPAENKSDCLLVKYRFYVTNFDLSDNVPLWAAYTVNSAMVANNDSKQRTASNPDFRRPRFWTDAAVRKASQDKGYTVSTDSMFVDTVAPDFPIPADIPQSAAQAKPQAIQRGHMVPNNAMKQCGTYQEGIAAQKESFSLANAVPEMAGHNAPTWSSLEAECFAWARAFGQVWCFVGPIYDRENPMYLVKRVGGAQQPIIVPDAMYYVVIAKRGGETSAIAFIIPHKPEEMDFKEYAVPVDEVEERTGIDFMPKLGEPNPIEQAIADKIHWLSVPVNTEAN